MPLKICPSAQTSWLKISLQQTMKRRIFSRQKQETKIKHMGLIDADFEFRHEFEMVKFFRKHQITMTRELGFDCCGAGGGIRTLNPVEISPAKPIFLLSKPTLNVYSGFLSLHLFGQNFNFSCIKQLFS